MVAHAYNPSYLGDVGRRTADQYGLGKNIRLYLKIN
jgi:hypothetical protein